MSEQDYDTCADCGAVKTSNPKKTNHAIGCRLAIAKNEVNIPLEQEKNTSLISAIILANKAHRGQFDRNGIPYIDHVLEVVRRVSHLGLTAMIVAALHDIVEDTHVTLDLIEKGFGKTVTDAVRATTKSDKETYHSYILRVKANPIASYVKRADLEHNLDDRRRYLGDESIRERYQKALDMLNE
jgi:(p)ppGpp synthase/HD superfamily hydrolase